jgi:hypothetical protein
MKKWGVCVRLPVIFYLKLVEEFRLNYVLNVYTKSRYGLHRSNPAHILCDIQVQIISSDTAHTIFNGVDFYIYFEMRNHHPSISNLFPFY